MSLEDLASDSSPPQRKTVGKNFVPFDVMICDRKGLRVETVLVHRSNNLLGLARIPTLFNSVQSALDYFNPSPLRCVGKYVVGSLKTPRK